MKNSIFIIVIILYQSLFLNNVFSKEIEFNATDIEVVENQNLTIANNGSAIIKDDGIIIEGVKIKYFKDQSLIFVNEGIIKQIDRNLKINSNTIEYYIDEGKINFTNKIIINDQINNLIIYSDKINYNIKNQIILGESKSKIIDEFDNTYVVDDFEYSIKDKNLTKNKERNNSIII